ncbi:hypothetical protein BC332_28181, partial [Capsicum chinense]
MEAEGRNRMTLGDIGNLAASHGVKENPHRQVSHPITRRFCAQLLEAAENQKVMIKFVVVNIKGANVAKKVPAERKPALKKTIIKQRPEDIIVVRGLSKNPKKQTVDIDAADMNNELEVFEYVEDIYSFYKLVEVSIVLNLSFIFISCILAISMINLIFGGSLQTYHKFDLNPEALYLIINIIDRYLAMETASRRELQLVGISAMLIASKYEEIWDPEVKYEILFHHMSYKIYSHDQVLTMEKQILRQLEWYLTVPTPYVFLVHFIKASLPNSE